MDKLYRSPTMIPTLRPEEKSIACAQLMVICDTKNPKVKQPKNTKVNFRYPFADTNL